MVVGKPMGRPTARRSGSRAWVAWRSAGVAEHDGRGVGRCLGGWLGVALLVVVVAAGCGERSGSPSAPTAHDPGVVHVHGLGVNPRDGALYAATHTGLFAIRDGHAARVGDRWRDTMGFTVVGPDHFLGSGHPDLRDRELVKFGRPPLLGLVEGSVALRCPKTC